MPLLKSGSKEAIASNIREMQAAGHPHNQSVAAALRVADEASRRQHLDFGGMPTPNMPYQARQDVREELYHPGGMINSTVAGRTDHLPMSVAAGSYIIPADVVSGLSEGNSMGGAAVLDKMMSTEPYGVHPPREHGGGHSMPRPPAPFHEQREQPQLKTGGRAYPRWSARGKYRLGGTVRKRYAEGGSTEKRPGWIPIIAAGGEYNATPLQVAGLGAKLRSENPKNYKGFTDLELGHESLDEFVKHIRKENIKDLKKLPGPAK